MATCSECGGPRKAKANAKSTLCRGCSARAVGKARKLAPPPPQSCSECGRALAVNRRRKGTRCQPCVASSIATDPAKLAKCRDAMVERFQEPGYVQRHGKAVSKGIGQAMKRNPAERERRRAWGKEVASRNVGRVTPPETRARMSKAQSDRLLAGIPIEYRDEYRRLVKIDRVPAADARVMILDQVARDTARYVETGAMPVHGRGLRKDGTCFDGNGGGQRQGGGA